MRIAISFKRVKSPSGSLNHVAVKAVHVASGHTVHFAGKLGGYALHETSLGQKHVYSAGWLGAVLSWPVTYAKAERAARKMAKAHFKNIGL